MRRAIAVSCNPYFIAMGMRLGYEPKLYDDCAQLGFGKAPDIGVQTASGLLPSNAWKRKRFRDSWRGGDTANISLGQGYLGTTPLQVAMMTSAIALDGKLMKPRLIRNVGDGTGLHEEPVVTGKMNWSAHDLKIVKAGMYDVLNEPFGTGRRSAVVSIRAAGKTGTAEYVENYEKKKHAWMIAFVPFESPRYAIAVVAEDADTGGQTAAAILKKIFLKLYPNAVPIETEIFESII